MAAGPVPGGPRARRPAPPPTQPPTQVPQQRHTAARTRSPYRSGDMPLLTHDETGATSVARAGAVALAERPAAPGPATGRPAGGATPPGGKPPFDWRSWESWRAWRNWRWKRIRRVLYVLLGLAVIAPVLAFVIGWMIFDVPTADDAAITQVATFTFEDGAPLATLRPENVNRVKVTLDRVPDHVKNAVLAAEDKTFYSNPGFDIAGIGRAVFNQLTGGVGGGSTITQQYVKVSTGQNDPSLWRKYKEVVLAVKISRELQKDEILENYLNTIYLGRSAYGIQAAATAYFGKDVEDLTVSEGAMLAGIIQSPSNWDPAKNPADTERRWAYVLDGMVDQRWVTPAERAGAVFPDNWLPEPPPLGGVPGDDRYHIYDRARAEMAAQGITDEQINTDGLTVTTSIDEKRQRDAVEAIKKEMKGQPDNLRAALVSVDPKTGAILAYYGGSNGVGTDYAEALRQPGSSFKPFVLAAALQGRDGVGLGTEYDGSSPQEFEGTKISNSEGFNCDKCTVKTAMTKSINTVFYRMALDVGTGKVIEAAHRAGIPENLLPEARGGIALGDQEVHPADMASAFATFAADGKRHEPYLVTKVVAADGRVLYDRGESRAEQAFPQQVARNVTESMVGVASSSKITLSDNRPVAVKTGTVQLPGSKDQNKDAWTVGYTPSLSTAVWIGTDQSDPIQNSDGRPIFGRMLPGSIWQEYMSDTLKGTPKEQFSKFDPIGDAPFDESEQSSGGSQPTGSPPSSGSSADSRDPDPSGILERLRNGRNGNGNGNRNGNASGNGGSDNPFVERLLQGAGDDGAATDGSGAQPSSAAGPSG